MKKIILVLLFCFVIQYSSAKNNKNDWVQDLVYLLKLSKNFLEIMSKILHQPEDAGKNITQILESHSYPCEQHIIVTEDGYKLQMFHIPHGRNETLQLGKPVVFLMHGLLSSAVDFVNIGPENSLGFLLVDLGYDVWLGNSRGNMYGRDHLTLNPNNNASFWDFSWHEQGVYDLPASIDYILNYTGTSKLTYIGHSQGTTNFFVMGSQLPEYNKKINLAVALAPVAFIQNLRSPLVKFLVKNRNIAELFVKNILKINEFPYSDWVMLLGEVFCNDNSGMQILCTEVFQLIAGFDANQLNATLLPVILTNSPSGCSVNQLVHYGQIVESGAFRQYDFGNIINLAKYGSMTPPNYNITDILAPVALFHAEDDFFVSECDVAQLITKLPNIVENSFIENFNHLDFIWAADAKTKVYNKVVNTLKKYVLH